jgi:hypothetical protein
VKDSNDIPLDVVHLSESSNASSADNKHVKNASFDSQSLRFKPQTTSVSDSPLSDKQCQKPPATLPKPTWTTNQIIFVKGRAAKTDSAITRHSVTATDQDQKVSSPSVTSKDSYLVIETTEAPELSPSTSKKAIGYPSSPPVPRKPLIGLQSPPPANKQLGVNSFPLSLKKATAPHLLASKESPLDHTLSPPIALKPLKANLSPQIANKPAIARIPLWKERPSKPTAGISSSVAMLASLYEADKNKIVCNSKTKESKGSTWIDIPSKCNIEQNYLQLTDNCKLNTSSKAELGAPKVDRSQSDIPSHTENGSYVTNSVVVIPCGLLPSSPKCKSDASKPAFFSSVGETSPKELPISSSTSSKSPAFKTVLKPSKTHLMGSKSPSEDRIKNKILLKSKPRTQPKPLSVDILKRFEGDINIPQKQHSQSTAKPASKPFEKRFTFNNFDTLSVNPNSPGYLSPASPTSFSPSSLSSFSFPNPSSLLTFLTLPRPSYKQPLSRSETFEVSTLFLIYIYN